MQAYLVGIAGATGSGKTTVARKIVDAVPEEQVVAIQHDSYYRDQPTLSPEAREAVNYDHPEALETDLLVEHLKALKAGCSVELPAYDFATHRRRVESCHQEPVPIIVIEGILVLEDPALRELLDLKIFVDTDADIRVFRRIRRDIEERGRTFESVRRQYYESVRPMQIQFVEPSKRWADVIIPEGGRNDAALDLVIAKLRSVVAERTF